MRNELDLPPVLRHAHENDQVGRRYIADRFSRPFDQTYGITTEIFAKPCIRKLFWNVKSVEIKVIPVYPRNYVNFNQCVGRASHRAGVAHGAQQGADKRRFSGAKVPIEPDHHAGNERGGELAAQTGSGRFVG